MEQSLLPVRSVLRQKMHVADPVADAVVHAIADHDPENCGLTVLKTVELLLRMPRFDAGLIAELGEHDPRIEAALTGFLEATFATPAGHSDRDVSVGNELFEENAVFGFVGLGCTSLLECYCWSIEAEVLGLTHGMGKNIARRIPETAMFVLDVMSDKAILEPGHSDMEKGQFPLPDQTPRGVAAIQKVRLLHSLIRWLIKYDPSGAGSVFDGPMKDSPFMFMLKADWPVQEKGEPISQAFLAGTLLTFSLTVIASMRRMLVPVSAEEARQYLHRWKVIGFKMGLDDDLLAYFDKEADAERLHSAMMAEFRGPTDPGKMMAATLENYMIENIVDRIPLHRLMQFKKMPRVAMWHLAGRDTCKVLNLDLDLFGKTLGWLGWQGLRFIGFLKRVPLLKRISFSVFEWLGRSMWGWRHEDDPTLMDHGKVVGGHPDKTKARGGHPCAHGIVIDRDLAERWGVPCK